MILQALVAYYDRLVREDKIVAPGWKRQPIGWIIHLDAEGHPTALECTYEKPVACKGAKAFTVPSHLTGARTGGIVPHLLWDDAAYVLGLGDERAKAKLQGFAERIKDLDLPALEPILDFLANNPAEALKTKAPDAFARLEEDNSKLMTFRLAGDDDIVCARQDVYKAYNAFWVSNILGDNLCLVTGTRGKISRTFPKTKFPNGLATGSSIVAFKEGKGFDSYGKTQGANAPIAEDTTFRYTTALQALIDSPDHRIRVGEETLLFWSSAPNPVEDALADLLGYHADTDDDSGAIALKGILTAAQQGQMPGFKDEGRFWLLLLQPVSARIAVRLWVEQTPTQTAIHLRDWFADLDVAKPPKEQGRPIPIYRLLASLSPQGDVKNLPPRLGGELLAAALRAPPLPDSIAQAVLRRLKSEAVTPIRAALLKAWLTRKPLTQPERKPTPMLDPSNDNPGYCLGRLFAVLEKVQEDALPGLNATIKDKFYATASSDPAAVFATLIRNNNHHIEKLAAERPQAKVFYEKLKQDILGHLNDIPAHLELADQARFALGYYHQRQDLFTKKEKPEAAPEAAPEQPITIQENLGI